MGLFTRENERTKLMQERDALQKEDQSLQTKATKINNAIQMAETEAMLEGTKTAESKVSKFKKGLQQTQKEQQELTKKAEKIGEKLGALNAEKNKEELEEIANSDIDSYREFKIANELEKKLDYFVRYELPEIAPASNSAEGYKPKGLLYKAGVEAGYFSPTDPAEKPLKELWETKKVQADKEALKKVEQVMEQLRKITE
ncbi:hypothetical protein [Virgibacillus natechei]|nr:hypothetical protein [Virgibacillus natechei]UZD13327.1 hypothetical protein OLD84_01825 [Virgibacillus natechei]